MYALCRLPLFALLVCCIPWLNLCYFFFCCLVVPHLNGACRTDNEQTRRIELHNNWIELNQNWSELNEKKKKKQNATNFEKSTKQTKANVEHFDHMVDNDGRICWIRWRMRLLWLCVAFFFVSLFVFLVETKFIYLLFGSINKKAACLKFKWNNALCGWRK